MTATPAPCVSSPGLSAPLLNIERLHLSVRQDDTLIPIVRDVSLSIRQGECFALIGESGSGKTMIARALMRLLPPALLKIEGRIIFEGEDIVAASAARMRSLRGARIAMIFQEPMSSLNPLMTIGRQIDEAIVTHQDLPPAERRRLAESLLADVRFKNPERLMRMYPHELSGGMRQRVMIAMAVSNRPALLIADEPTTALDVSIQAEVMDILARLRMNYGIALLFISHDLSLVAQYADRVGVLYGGDLMEVAATKDIVQSPHHPYSAALMSCIPRRRIDGRRQLGVEGTVPKLATPDAWLPLCSAMLASRRRLRRWPYSDERNRGGAGPMPSTARMTEEPLLVASGIRKAFSHRERWWKPVSHAVALADVSLEVNKAEILGLLGESGSGKSTLARIIVGLTKADAGSLAFNGRVLFGGKDPPVKAAQRGIQMVFQDPYSSLNPRMRIDQLISEGLQIAGRLTRAQIGERVARCMELVGLDPKDRFRYPHQFSGGQRQRISIARALVMEPRLLIADEAVSALDVSVQMQILNLLLDLRETMGLSILFITHNLAVVEYLCDRVAVIENGSIVESGRTSAVFDNPQQPYTKALLKAAPKLVTPVVSNLT